MAARDRKSIVILLGVLHAMTSSISKEFSRETVHEDMYGMYQYRLECSSIFGKISESALPGSEVPLHPTLSHHRDGHGHDSLYLRLELWENAVFRNGTSINDSMETAQHKRKLTVIPPSLVFDVSSLPLENSNAHNSGVTFTVNENRHIVVSDSTDLKNQDQFSFWVVTINRTEGQPDTIVSNPLPVLIFVDHTPPESEGAAIYVGVIVVFICAIALLIPFTVRTKRRLKQGKPICACGSSNRQDDVKNGSVERKFSSEPVNLAMIFNERKNSLAPKHETFQSHALRSLSEHHFQPRWLDPHYKDTYEHPVYHHSQFHAKNVSTDKSQHQQSSSSRVKDSTKTTATSNGAVVEKF